MLDDLFSLKGRAVEMRVCALLNQCQIAATRGRLLQLALNPIGNNEDSLRIEQRKRRLRNKSLFEWEIE